MVKYPDYLQEIACPYLLIDCDLNTHQNTLQLFTCSLTFRLLFDQKTIDIADLTRVKCDMVTPLAPPYQGGVQRETLTASCWGAGLSNWVSHSVESRYSN